MFNFYKIQLCAQTKIKKRRIKKQTHTIYLSINSFLHFDVVCKELFKHDNDESFLIHSLSFLTQYCLDQKELDYFNNSLCHFLFESDVYNSIKSSPQRECYSDSDLSYNFYMLSFEAIERINVFDQEQLKVDKIFYGIHNLVNIRQFLSIDFSLEKGFYELKNMEIFSQYSLPKRISSDFGFLGDCKTTTQNKIEREIEIQDRNMRINSILS